MNDVQIMIEKEEDKKEKIEDIVNEQLILECEGM